MWWVLLVYSSFFFQTDLYFIRTPLNQHSNVNHLRDQGSRQIYCHPLKWLTSIYPTWHEIGQDMESDAHGGVRNGSRNIQQTF
jgi:hypothetical protein